MAVKTALHGIPLTSICRFSVPTGDIILQVSSDLSDTTIPRVCFLVNSKVLATASPVFRSMFDRNLGFAESNMLDSDSKIAPTITLEDEPDALEVVLQVLHHSTRLVRRDLGFSIIVQISAIADKYGCGEALQFCIEALVKLPEFEVAQMKQPCYFDWLFVCWVFNLPELWELSLVVLSDFSVKDDGESVVFSNGTTFMPQVSPRLISMSMASPKHSSTRLLTRATV